MDSFYLPPIGPGRVYALLLKLRPIQRGTLMAFSGELVHGAWMEWIRAVSPDISAALHEGNRQRPFTCSSLRFPLHSDRMRPAETENKHLHLEPEKQYTIRVTLLQGELFPLFYHALLQLSTRRDHPFIRLGKQEFKLEGVTVDPEDRSGWTGSTTFEEMVHNARTLYMRNTAQLELHFESLTSIKRMFASDKVYGGYTARLPLPHYIFPELARRWQQLAPENLANMVQRERIEAYIQAEGIIIDDYDLRAHVVHFTTHIQKGFIGSCQYLLRGPDERPTPEEPLTVRQQIMLLSFVAFYTGIGAKTAMGLGQTWARL